MRTSLKLRAAIIFKKKRMSLLMQLLLNFFQSTDVRSVYLCSFLFLQKRILAFCLSHENISNGVDQSQMQKCVAINKESQGELPMRESTVKNYEELPLFLSAKLVSEVLGVSPSSAYELMHEKDFPALRIGNRLVVPKDHFREWVDRKLGK